MVARIPYDDAYRLAGHQKENTPYGFVADYGYYTDTASRDYVRARELEKRLGRWMQTDPYPLGDCK